METDGGRRDLNLRQITPRRVNTAQSPFRKGFNGLHNTVRGLIILGRGHLGSVVRVRREGVGGRRMRGSQKRETHDRLSKVDVMKVKSLVGTSPSVIIEVQYLFIYLQTFSLPRIPV